MRKIPLVALVFALGLAIFLFSKRDQKIEKPILLKEEPTIVVPSKNEAPIAKKSIFLSGIVVPKNIKKIAFQVNGTVENGEQDFKSGTKFKKGQLLFQVNNLDAYLKMQSAKISLKEKLNVALPQLQNDRKSWKNYISTLEPVSLIGELPESNISEQVVMNLQQIKEEHLNIKKMEANMSNYFWIAPFDGVIIQQLVKTGNKIKSGQTIAQIGQSGKFLIQTKAGNDLPEITSKQTIKILNKEKELIGKGKYVKSVPAKGDSSEVYFRLEKGKKLLLGTEVFVEVEL